MWLQTNSLQTLSSLTTPPIPVTTPQHQFSIRNCTHFPRKHEGPDITNPCVLVAHTHSGPLKVRGHIRCSFVSRCFRSSGAMRRRLCGWDSSKVQTPSKRRTLRHDKIRSRRKPFPWERAVTHHRWCPFMRSVKETGTVEFSNLSQETSEPVSQKVTTSVSRLFHSIGQTTKREQLHWCKTVTKSWIGSVLFVCVIFADTFFLSCVTR